MNISKLIYAVLILITFSGCATHHQMAKGNNLVFVDSQYNLMWVRNVNKESTTMDGGTVKHINSLEVHNPNYYNYNEAIDFIDKLNSSNYAGYSNWRLPSINELKRLTDLAEAKIAKIQRLMKFQNKQLKYHRYIANGLHEMGYYADLGACWSSNTTPEGKALSVSFSDYKFISNEDFLASQRKVCPVRSILPLNDGTNAAQE